MDTCHRCGTLAATTTVTKHQQCYVCLRVGATTTVTKHQQCKLMAAAAAVLRWQQQCYDRQEPFPTFTIPLPCLLPHMPLSVRPLNNVCVKHCESTEYVIVFCNFGFAGFSSYRPHCFQPSSIINPPSSYSHPPPILKHAQS